MIKPDGVQRGLMGKIVSRFEEKGFKNLSIKLCSPGKEHFEKHYAELKSKPFFDDLVKYASSGPVCAMVWEGDNSVSTLRKMLGATNPKESNTATIRGDYSIDVGRNVIHASDSVKKSAEEIALWFDKSEIKIWTHHSQSWIYE